MLNRLGVFFLLTLIPVAAKAQRITAPVEIARCQFEEDSGLLQRWAQNYYGLQTEADAHVLRKWILEKLTRNLTSSSGGPCTYHFDFSRPHSIVFPIPEEPAANQARSLVRLLIWNRDDPVYATNLRGSAELLEVFITTQPGDELGSIYYSTAVEDPRAADIAAAVKQLVPVLAGQLAAEAYRPAVNLPPKAPKKYFVRVGRVVLPFSRATVAIKSQLSNSSNKDYNTKGEASYDSATLNRIGFALVGAGILRVGGAHRAKTDSGNIVEDSFDGVASIIAVNFHPWAYDPTQLPISSAERWRLFGGVVATPELGLAVGGGWAPFRSLSINAGYAWLRVKTTKLQESFGSPPPEGDTNPLRHGTARAFVFGVGYKFS